MGPEGIAFSERPVRTQVLDDLVWKSVENLLLIVETILDEYQRRLKTYKLIMKLLLLKKTIKLMAIKENELG